MSIKQMMLVWEHEFPHPEQSVMLALADHAHEDGTGIRPSLDRVAWKTGYSRRNVQMIIGRLKTSGVVEVEAEATPRSPAELRFNWSKASPKKPFNEYRESANKAKVDAKKSRGASSAPPDSEVQPGSSQGCSLDHPWDEAQITPGVIPSSPEPSINHPLIQNEPSANSAIEKKEFAKKNKYGYVSFAWLTAHNEYKPDAWPSVTTMDGKSRAAGIKAMIEAFGGENEAIAAYRLVLTWLRTGTGTTPSWWRSRDITFENFVKTTGKHVVSCYELAVKSGLTDAIPASATGVEASVAKSSEAEIRQQHNRLHQPGSQLIPGSGFTRPGVSTIWDLLRNPSEAAEYLKWLRSQEPEDDDHPMAI